MIAGERSHSSTLSVKARGGTPGKAKSAKTHSPGALTTRGTYVTPEAVRDWYAHFNAARVLRYDLPGFNALNFVVDESLAGGINNSPRLDAAAKGMGQHLLEFPVPPLRPTSWQ